MSQELFSVEQVAERLGLQVRTVRAYVRDGRLKARKIGKQYRIARADLEALSGPVAQAPRRHLEVASIVEIEAMDREAAIAATNLILAAANGRSAREEPLRVETLYDEDRQRLKVIVVGGLSVTADLLKLIAVWAEAGR